MSGVAVDKITKKDYHNNDNVFVYWCICGRSCYAYEDPHSAAHRFVLRHRLCTAQE